MDCGADKDAERKLDLMKITGDVLPKADLGQRLAFGYYIQSDAAGREI
jgi:hypothetical protein